MGPGRQTNLSSGKYTRWSATIWENEWQVLSGTMPDIIKGWGYQEEIAPTTGTRHYQAWILCHKQERMSALKKIFPTAHLEGIPSGAKGPNGGDRWQGLLDYCQKEQSRAPGAKPIQEYNPKQHVTMEQALTALAKYHVPSLPMFSPKHYKQEYWVAVSQVLRETPDLVGVYASPNMEKVWVNTRNVWIEKWISEPLNKYFA